MAKASLYEVWIVKHLRDLSSSRPETDVELFTDEQAARDWITKEIEHTKFKPFRPEDEEEEDTEEPCSVWYNEDRDEYLELDGPRRPLGEHATIMLYNNQDSEGPEAVRIFSTRGRAVAALMELLDGTEEYRLCESISGKDVELTLAEGLAAFLCGGRELSVMDDDDFTVASLRAVEVDA